MHLAGQSQSGRSPPLQVLANNNLDGHEAEASRACCRSLRERRCPQGKTISRKGFGRFLSPPAGFRPAGGCAPWEQARGPRLSLAKGWQISLGPKARPAHCQRGGYWYAHRDRCSFPGSGRQAAHRGRRPPGRSSRLGRGGGWPRPFLRKILRHRAPNACSVGNWLAIISFIMSRGFSASGAPPLGTVIAIESCPPEQGRQTSILGATARC